MGLIPVVRPEFFAHLPLWMSPITHSGIAMATLSALTLNLLPLPRHRTLGERFIYVGGMEEGLPRLLFTNNELYWLPKKLTGGT